MLTLLLIGCGEPDPEPLPEEEETEEGIVLTISPESVAFGSVELGSSGLAELALTNGGSSTLFLAELGSDDESLDVSAPGVLTIEPNRIATVEVAWTPMEPTTLAAQGWLRVGTSPTALEETTFAITGQADGPAAVYSSESVEIGQITVGCNGSDTIDVMNVGTTDLVIDDLAIDYAPEFAIVSEELPITVAPNETASIELLYTPTATQSTATTLYISTNDPFNPTQTIAASANGWIEADNEIYWEVVERQPITILMMINEIAIYQTHASKLAASIETFFTYLDEFDVQFRMACFLHENGTQHSSTLYIDETYDAEDSVDVFYDMLSGSSLYGDNDANMQTLDNALEESQDWLFEGVYENSKLNMFTINDDQDTSPLTGKVYVNNWRAWKDDDDDVQVHAIAGFYSNSCGAVYFSKYEEAIDETGGLFLDICASDWSSYMEQIVEAFLGDIQQFELTGSPAASTIEVYWDGIPQTSGWTYDSSQNEVQFDSTSYPPNGTTLRIYYLMATECPS